MIIVTREGVLIYADPLTEEQTVQGWAIVLSAFLKAHPEALSMNKWDSEDNKIDCPAHTECL